MALSDVVRPERATPLPSEEYRLLVESVVDYAIFMLDNTGRITSWNRGAQQIKGYTASEVIGEHFSTFYPPEDIAAGKPERELALARERGRVEDEGYRVRKDGSRFWASVVLTALRDESGALRGFAKVTRDRTAEHEAEVRLRESEQRFHHLIDAVIDYAIFVLDPRGHVSTWNSGARRVKGYSAEEIVGRHFSVFYTAEDRENGKPERVLAAVRSSGRFEEEGFRVRKDGSRFWASVIVTALRDEKGELIGFAKVTRDLTERRRAEETERELLREQTARAVAEAGEERLRQSEERYRSLSARLEIVLEGVADGITVQDRSQRIVFANGAAARLCGLEGVDELLNKQAADIVARFAIFDENEQPFPHEQLPSRRVLAGERSASAVFLMRELRSGREGWASVRSTAVLGSDGKPELAINIWHDVSAERRQERDAQRAARLAEEASRAKDEFLATVSHELRTPLSAILGWSKLLKDRVTDPAVIKPIEVIYRNAQAQVKIIDDILDVSRVITGKFALEIKPTDVVALTNDAIDVVRQAAAAKRISIDFTPDGSLFLLEADTERLKQAVWNLLSNAVKFTQADGSIAVSLRHEDRNIVLSVSDTGIGIDARFLPFVFDRFKQADASSTRRVSGLGLGLALVRHIVELHGGTVSAASDGPGRGSTFTLHLPVRAGPRASSEPPSVRQRTARASGPMLSGLRVLVVDDEPDASALTAEVLGSRGAQVEQAASVREAYALFERFRPELIVSDIAMPDEDGFSFIRRIRSLPPAQGGRVPAIALTAFASESDSARALEFGYSLHLGKPVDPDALAEAAARLVTPLGSSPPAPPVR